MKYAILCTSFLLLVACGQKASAPPVSKGVGSITRVSPELDGIVPTNAIIEKLAGGFGFTEGPLWREDGHLWFSDVTANVLRSITPGGEVKVLLEKAGGASDAPAGSFIGPNGMVATVEGLVLLCQHTNRRIVQIDRDMKQTVLIDKYEGKRLNSPNDLVYNSDGSLYFTDPPYGLPKQDDDPAKELKFNGVFRYKDGKLTVLVKDLARPNGIALSPDGKVLYVSNSDEKQKIWMRYALAEDGTVSNGRIFASAMVSNEPGLPDGMKVDSQGNIYGTGPGGVWVFSPSGIHLGIIKTPETPANVAWGDDGKSLYITATTSIYRVKLSVTGEKPLYR